MNDEGWEKKRERPDDANDDETPSDKKPAAPNDEQPLVAIAQQPILQQPMANVQNSEVAAVIATSQEMVPIQDYPMGDETAHLKTKSRPLAGPRARGSMKLAKATESASATGATAEASSVAAATASIVQTAQSIVSGVIQTVSSWQSQGSGEEPSSEHHHAEQRAFQQMEAFEQPLPSSSFSSIVGSDIDAFDDPDL
jgi:hypothetical protein